MTDSFAGKLADPEWRSQRATKAAKARTSLAYHIQQVVDHAPALSDTDVERLRSLLNLPCRCDHPREEAASA